MYQHKYKN